MPMLALGLVLIVCLPSILWAAGEPPDAQFLRDYAETHHYSLGHPVAATLTPDATAVLFLRAQPRIAQMALYEFDVATGKTRPWLTPEQVLKGSHERLTPEEKARRERQRISVGGFTGFQLSEDGGLVLLSLSGKLYIVRRDTADVRELPTGDGAVLDPHFSHDGRSIAFVREHDLWVLDIAAGNARALTHGGSAGLSHGEAEFVAQEEMGRFSGYWWSPDSRLIAYEQADASGVEVWHVSDPAHPEQPAFESYYPRPGKANVKARLGVIPAAGGQTVWVEWDSLRYPYLAVVRWDEHGPLTLGVETRDQRELLLLKVDPATGQTTPLLTERDTAWINLPPGMPHWLEDGSGFLWSSERDGGPNLELHAPDGTLRRIIAPPSAGYRALVDAGPQIVFAGGQDPTQRQIFRVPIDGGEIVPLTRDPGFHSAAFSRNHAAYVEVSSSVAAVGKQTVHRADGMLLGELPSVAEQPPFLPRVEILRIGPGLGFYADVVRPRNFDPALRYPVIVDVYGGPHANHVVASARAFLIDQWLADRGFIVVSIDGRGTPGRGRQWERALLGHLGSVPLEDQVAGLRALGERFPEMDLDRAGIFGWSFGGYLSALAVLRQPDVYKAAVAGARAVDWEDYDTFYTERYLGLPQANAEAYKQASLLTWAGDLQRPLLLIHGTADDNVYFRHTLRLADALLRAGRPFELLPLSGSTHMVPDPILTQRLWERIATHFQQHLGKPVKR